MGQAKRRARAALAANAADVAPPSVEATSDENASNDSEVPQAAQKPVQAPSTPGSYSGSEIYPPRLYCVMTKENMKKLESMGVRDALNIVRRGAARNMVDLLPDLLDEYDADDYLFVLTNSRAELDYMLAASVMHYTRLAQASGMVSLQSAIDMARYYRKRLDDHYEKHPETRAIAPSHRRRQLRHLDELQESTDEHGIGLLAEIQREEQRRDKARQTNQRQMRLRMENLALRDQRRAQRPRRSDCHE